MAVWVYLVLLLALSGHSSKLLNLSLISHFQPPKEEIFMLEGGGKYCTFGVIHTYLCLKWPFISLFSDVAFLSFGAVIYRCYILHMQRWGE